MTRAVLVTGGAGYIGSHACKALSAAGYSPVAYDNLCNGHKESVQWGPLVEGDIRDKKRLKETFQKYRPIAVMHFAAFAEVSTSLKEPLSYYGNNVAGAILLLEAMQESGLKTLIFSSTCATYGIPDEIPIRESTVQEPTHPYGKSKWIVETILKDLVQLDGWRVALLRYFNAAGADEEARIGENHTPETHLIPLVIEAALGKRSSVSLFGTDYPTPDGTAIRDYIHVDDLADAHVLALQHLLTSSSPLLELNLGTGKGHSVQEVIDAVERISGKKVPVERKDRRPGDPPVLVADTQCAQTLLHWRPRKPSLDTIISSALAWHQRVS